MDAANAHGVRTPGAYLGNCRRLELEALALLAVDRLAQRLSFCGRESERGGRAAPEALSAYRRCKHGHDPTLERSVVCITSL
jgi:hypothetical protein